MKNCARCCSKTICELYYAKCERCKMLLKSYSKVSVECSFLTRLVAKLCMFYQASNLSNVLLIINSFLMITNNSSKFVRLLPLLAKFIKSCKCQTLDANEPREAHQSRHQSWCLTLPVPLSPGPGSLTARRHRATNEFFPVRWITFTRSMSTLLCHRKS